MTITDHPLVARARLLAAEVLEPEAERVDQEGVPASHIEAVKRSGLLGLTAPAGYGGAAAPPAVVREVSEILAGACGSTWFVQSQHHTPVQVLTRGEPDARDRLLGPLARGELLSGVAYAQLRAHPEAPVRAHHDGTGWRFDGRVPWYTGWGLNDVLLLAGLTDDDEAVFAFVEAREQQGLRPSGPLRLAALTGASTVSLELDRLRVPDDSLALRIPYADWAPTDRAKTLNTNPAVFGIAAAALSLLDDDTAAPLRTRLTDIRTRAYALADHPSPLERVEERLAVRAEAYAALTTATTAAVAAGGGRSMSLTSRAQRLAREGMFLLIQGQTAETRRAHLEALAR
ncbi:acyl-CoA dehydrogenase family protein [Streptomyces sp. NPDC085596]|uniref:acyl-CoA dehydrogenase family protein n=1 Tax=Streptomyces sp. NPDC085596 TaxID=3365731 RepID=UPI0037D8D000